MHVTAKSATKVPDALGGGEEEVASQPILQMDEEEQCADITEFVDVLRDATAQHGNTQTMAALTTAVGRMKKIRNSNMLNSMLLPPPGGYVSLVVCLSFCPSVC